MSTSRQTPPSSSRHLYAANTTTVPDSFRTTHLPGLNHPISYILSWQFPPFSHESEVKPVAKLSTRSANIPDEAIAKFPVPTAAFLASARDAIHKKGSMPNPSRSIYSPLIGDDERRFPYWAITYWSECLTLESQRREYARARTWVKDKVSAGHLNSNFYQRIMADYKQMSWATLHSGLANPDRSGHLPEPHHLLPILSSNHWLEDIQIDLLTKIVSVDMRRQHVRGLIAPLQFWRELEHLDMQDSHQVKFTKEKYPCLTSIYSQVARASCDLGFIVNNGTLRGDMGTHWSACVLHLSQHAFSYADSFGMTTPPPILQSRLEKWLYRCGDGMRLQLRSEMKIARQTDGYSCGLLAVNALENYFLEDPLWKERHDATLRVSKYINLLEYNGEDRGALIPPPGRQRKDSGRSYKTASSGDGMSVPPRNYYGEMPTEDELISHVRHWTPEEGAGSGSRYPRPASGYVTDVPTTPARHLPTPDNTPPKSLQEKHASIRRKKPPTVEPPPAASSSRLAVPRTPSSGRRESRNSDIVIPDVSPTRTSTHSQPPPPLGDPILSSSSMGSILRSRPLFPKRSTAPAATGEKVSSTTTRIASWMGLPKKGSEGIGTPPTSKPTNPPSRQLSRPSDVAQTDTERGRATRPKPIVQRPTNYPMGLTPEGPTPAPIPSPPSPMHPPSPMLPPKHLQQASIPFPSTQGGLPDFPKPTHKRSATDTVLVVPPVASSERISNRSSSSVNSLWNTIRRRATTTQAPLENGTPRSRKSSQTTIDTNTSEEPTKLPKRLRKSSMKSSGGGSRSRSRNLSVTFRLGDDDDETSQRRKVSEAGEKKPRKTGSELDRSVYTRKQVVEKQTKQFTFDFPMLSPKYSQDTIEQRHDVHIDDEPGQVVIYAKSSSSLSEAVRDLYRAFKDFRDNAHEHAFSIPGRAGERLSHFVVKKRLEQETKMFLKVDVGPTINAPATITLTGPRERMTSAQEHVWRFATLVDAESKKLFELRWTSQLYSRLMMHFPQMLVQSGVAPDEEEARLMFTIDAPQKKKEDGFYEASSRQDPDRRMEIVCYMQSSCFDAVNKALQNFYREYNQYVAVEVWQIRVPQWRIHALQNSHIFRDPDAPAVSSSSGPTKFIPLRDFGRKLDVGILFPKDEKRPMWDTYQLNKVASPRPHDTEDCLKTKIYGRVTALVEFQQEIERRSRHFQQINLQASKHWLQAVSDPSVVQQLKRLGVDIEIKNKDAKDPMFQCLLSAVTKAELDAAQAAIKEIVGGGPRPQPQPHQQRPTSAVASSSHVDGRRMSVPRSGGRGERGVTDSSSSSATSPRVDVRRS